MTQTHDDEPLFPPWVLSVGKILGPILVLIGIWWLFTSVFKLPAKVMTPAIALLVLFVAIFLGGRFYKPFYVEKGTGKCIAKGAKQRMNCRHYIPGARLGGGCGRQREDRTCRYVR
ncbi:MAG: hypothetical protein JXA57_08675 [Armatimonadetes bacterium]|nr:hypothetical protein [Armatimonadota bacterium]